MGIAVLRRGNMGSLPIIQLEVSYLQNSINKSSSEGRGMRVVWLVERVVFLYTRRVVFSYTNCT